MIDPGMHEALTDLAGSEPIPNDEDGKARVHAHAEETRRRLAEAGEAAQGGEEPCASQEVAHGVAASIRQGWAS